MREGDLESAYEGGDIKFFKPSEGIAFNDQACVLLSIKGVVSTIWWL